MRLSFEFLRPHQSVASIHHLPGSTMIRPRPTIRTVALAALVLVTLVGSAPQVAAEQSADDRAQSTNFNVENEMEDEAAPAEDEGVMSSSSSSQEVADTTAVVTAPQTTRTKRPPPRRGGAGDDGVAPAMLKNGSPPRSIVLIANGKVRHARETRCRKKQINRFLVLLSPAAQPSPPRYRARASYTCRTSRLVIRYSAVRR